MKTTSIDEAQELRKEGFTIVINSNLTKVLLITKNEDDAYELKKKFLLKNKVVKIFYPLNKIKISNEDVKEALLNYKKGLNCNF